MPTPPRRRWFQFSLATMFVVVTIFAIWLKWELNFVHERKEAIGAARHNPGHEPIDDLADDTVFVIFPGDSPNTGNPRLPFWRIWLGDQPVAGVATPPDASDETIHKWKRLFPEAEVEPYDISI
ncbi:MAG TPA: hypothetical protein VGJ26_16630 [Pirellulales bacterium]|jgi:hypothetical protein